MKFPLALLFLVMITACASRGAPPVPPTAADLADAKLPVRCGSREQCDRWWRTAQVWVVKNAGYKVQIATDAKLPVRCGSREQCDRWWRTAQVWVVKNAGYKVQIATDAIVQTAGPDFGSQSWSFLVTRAPHVDGGEAIEIEARCGNAASCAPAYETAIADFKRAVRGTR